MENDNYNPTQYTTIAVYGGGMEGRSWINLERFEGKKAKSPEESLSRDGKSLRPLKVFSIPLTVYI